MNIREFNDRTSELGILHIPLSHLPVVRSASKLNEDQSAYKRFGHICETPQGSLTLADSTLRQTNEICGPSHLKDADLLQVIDKRIASINKALRGEHGNRLRRFETTERPTWRPTWLFSRDVPCRDHGLL
ncbi:hypothetical protein N7530_010522 [Penicillium desertorum]|uniref:Uncharacterized protein n=1 Tax=Penicillium desertorum TaxID=1303715 RepID=A0A9W9WI33_9EURO|nr:hypothetical protein N7530_010522 [Penicillium desertorum]